VLFPPTMSLLSTDNTLAHLDRLADEAIGKLG
jgi:hypothetical protein